MIDLILTDGDVSGGCIFTCIGECGRTYRMFIGRAQNITYCRTKNTTGYPGDLPECPMCLVNICQAIKSNRIQINPDEMNRKGDL